MASLSKDPSLPFRPIFARCSFRDSVFRRTVPSGWSGRREVLSGGAASLPPFCWVVLLGLLLLRVVVLFSLPFLRAASFLLFLWVKVAIPPPFGWCCLPLPSLGGTAVPLFRMKGHQHEYPPPPRVTVVRSSSSPPPPCVVVAPLPTPSSFSGGSPPPSAFGGGLPSLPKDGGSHSTTSGYGFAPSSTSAGGSRPPPSRVGS